MLAACGGSTPPVSSMDCPDAGLAMVPDTGPTPDAGMDAGTDAGTALFPRYPRVRSHGGLVQTQVHLRVAIAAGDPLAGALETFSRDIVTSAWWAQVTAEYCGPNGCIGPGAFDGTVTLPPATSYSEDDVRALIAADLANPAVREPDAQSNYLLFIPAGATFTQPFGAPSCSGYHAYHYFLTLQSRAGAPVRVPYSVMLRCSDSSTLRTQTFLASHELVEAATDPFMDGFVVDDSGWAATHGAELADVCLYSGTTTAGPHEVERVYSDRRAARGLDPCRLDSDGVDFTTVPVSGRTLIVLRPGEATTIPLRSRSLGAVPDWTLQALSLDARVQLSLSSTTTNDGQDLTLTVSAAAALPATFQVPFILSSKSGGVTHAWQGAVGSLYE
ncbi:MAG: hypothetical protein K1X89_25265 [Myxococcaceae bacterium]|nr:hypothetical protein [Myxococcaceae bacterium]